MACFLLWNPAFAEGVRINEVVSNPESGGEWVEFFAEEESDLSGFSLSDEKGVMFIFPDNSLFSAGDFFVAEGWNNKLNNTGDSVFLRDAEGNDITAVEGFPKMDKGESWAWNGLGFQKTESITKAEENIFPEPEETPADEHENTLGKGFLSPQNGEIEITEIMSNPETGDEWVEIFSSASEIRNMSAFTFSDEVGIIFTFPEDFGISPGEFLVVSGWSNKLNNSGDSIFLKDISGTLFDSEKDFPALDKNISWAKNTDTSFEKTSSPTPGETNAFVTVTAKKSSGKKSQLVKTKATIPSVSASEIEIVLSEILFRGKDEDYVELFCKKCDVDLGGFRLVDDDTFFEFPYKTYVKSGEYIVVYLSKNNKQLAINNEEKLRITNSSIANTEYVGGQSRSAANARDRNFEPSQPVNQDQKIHHFYANKTGLIGTDETIFLLDSRGNIEHAVCIANQNGSFSSGERSDVISLINQRALRAYHPLSEQACFDSRLLGTNISLVFSGQKTGYSDKDFFWSPHLSPGEKNPKTPLRAEKIKIEMNVYQNEKIAFVEIKNTGQKLLNTKNIRLFSETEEGIIEIQKESRVLLPGEIIFVEMEKDIVSLRATDFWETDILSIRNRETPKKFPPPSFPLDGNRRGTSDAEKPTDSGWSQNDNFLDISSFLQEETNIVFSEVFANPEGEDADKEFVEILCLADTCETENFFLFFNGKRIFPEEKQMSLRERNILFLPVKNTEFSAEVYDLLQKKVYVLHVPHSKEGKSWSRFAEQRYEWAEPTPEKENIIHVQDVRQDSDQDGIPDVSENKIQSNPFSVNTSSSTEKKLFENLLRHQTNVSFLETEKDLRISGSSFPSAEIFFVMHSKKTILKTMTDEQGKFSFSGNPNLSPGNHSLDILIFPTKNHPLLLKKFTEFSIAENPKDKLLQNLEIILALPNPTGSDATGEMMVLQNTGAHDGFLIGAKIRSEEKEVTLPEIFLKRGQKKVIRANMLPTLLNTDSSLSLLNSQGKILSTVSWEKARSGEWFGENAPVFVPPKKKAKKRKLPKYRAPIPLPRPADPPQNFAGEFRFLARDYVGVRLPNGETRAYKLGEGFSKEAVHLLISPGEEVQISVASNKIFEISLPHRVFTEAISSSNFLSETLLLLFLGFAVGASFGLSQIRKFA